MKKRNLHPVKTLLILCLVSFIFSTAHAEWTLLGLANDTVLCIALDKANRVIAGTKTGGIKLYDDSAKWLDINSKKLPVNDVAFTTGAGFIAAMGAGTNSDGVYYAKATGTPPYYSVSSMPIYGMMFPQSVACTPEGDTIYMGGRIAIASGIKDASSGEYGNFSTIKTPPSAFGTKQPKCAALHVMTSQLYAGGYDESPDPGQGHLLWSMGKRDSLSINSAINVTCITEVFKEQGGKHLFAGTHDSGIYFRISTMSMPIAKYADIPGKGPVNDMMSITLPDIGIMSASLCIAEKSGVFVRPANAWIEIGDIPVEPFCIAGYLRIGGINRYFLYAGTPKGVYVNDFTGVLIKNQPTSHLLNNVSVQCRKDRAVVIALTMPRSGNVRIDILNSAGRKLLTATDGYLNSGRHALTIKMNAGMNRPAPNGVYFCSIYAGNELYNRRFAILR